jgi:hypothetical protein
VTALTQWIALNVKDDDQLAGVHAAYGLDGKQYDLVDLLDIWEPNWRDFTQANLGAIPAEELPSFDPDRACVHADFEAGVSVQRIVADDVMEAVGYYAEVQVACKVCDERWRWTGLEPGLNPRRPTMTVDGHTLIAPFRPASADDDFGMSLPGFGVNVIGANGSHAMTAAAVRKRALEDAARAVDAESHPTMAPNGRRALRHASAAINKLMKDDDD